jgi:predicted Ser/Thr protein kinase
VQILAEFELVVNYRPKAARYGLAIMATTMIVWSVIIPFCLGLFISLLFNPDYSSVNAWLAIAVVAVLGSVPLSAIFLSAICEDDRILISKEGVAFPLFMLGKLGVRRDRMWSELTQCDLLLASERENKNGLPDGKLTLRFKEGEAVPLSLKLLDKSNLEQFLLAVEVWGKNCKREPALIEFQNGIQNSTRGVEQFSYTQMWEEELSRRFSATSFVPLEPGKKLQNGKLNVVRQLAFGGLSAIYLAQRNEKDLVVLKEAVVPPNSDENSRAKAVELFQREAQLLIKLNNSNIAKVYDHFQEEGRNYLTLEYIKGQDLRQLVKQHGPQPPEVVLPWFRRMAEILTYLHTQDPPIIHRDLTPDNVVRREDNDVVLIDFGAANEFVGTATGTLVGKQAYISPEQLRGKATTSSDIYALGGTVHFLLTGKDPEALSSSHPKELNAEIPDGLDHLVSICTEMETCDRPSSAHDLVTLIDRVWQALPDAAASGADRGNVEKGKIEKSNGENGTGKTALIAGEANK